MQIFEEDDMDIAVGTVFHNKGYELKRTLYSMSNEGIDYWFLIGGAFRDSKDPVRGTDAETYKIIDTFRTEQAELGSRGIQVIFEDMPESNEFEKRMKYLDMCRQYECDGLFIVDSDEYVYENTEWDFVTDWEKFRRYWKSWQIRFPRHNVYSVYMIHSEFLGRDVHSRCWVNPSNMVYVKGSHYKFANPEEDDFSDILFHAQTSFGIVEGITLKHDHNLRTDDDMKYRRSYQDYLANYESFLEQQNLTGHNPEIAKKLAEQRPIHLDDRCICLRCARMKGVDPEQIFDPRPRDRRQRNPYVDGIPL